jgi:hypothetical protein
MPSIAGEKGVGPYFYFNGSLEGRSVPSARASAAHLRAPINSSASVQHSCLKRIADRINTLVYPCHLCARLYGTKSFEFDTITVHTIFSPRNQSRLAYEMWHNAHFRKFFHAFINRWTMDNKEKIE